MNPLIRSLALVVGLVAVVAASHVLAAHRSEPRPAPAMSQLPKVTPFLWFDDDAEAALERYSDIFEDFEVLEESRWGAGGPMREGALMSATFRLAGQTYIAFNGGPTHRLNESFSLLVDCRSQEEIDSLWAKLGEGGAPGRCGWLKDAFGLSWQIVPHDLGSMLRDSDRARAGRVAQAMMQMGKLDLSRLTQAYEGR